MEGESKRSISMCRRYTPHVAWYREDKPADGPCPASCCAHASCWTAANFYDGKYVHKFLDEPLSSSCERVL